MKPSSNWNADSHRLSPSVGVGADRDESAGAPRDVHAVDPGPGQFPSVIVPGWADWLPRNQVNEKPGPTDAAADEPLRHNRPSSFCGVFTQTVDPGELLTV